MKVQIDIPDELVSGLIRQELSQSLPGMTAEIRGELLGRMLEEEVEFDAKGACQFLGAIRDGRVKPISRRTLANFMQRTDNPLPHRKVGGKLRFDKTKIMAWRERETYLSKARRIKVVQYG